MVAGAWNSNAEEAESEGSRIWGEPGLHNKAQSQKKINLVP